MCTLIACQAPPRAVWIPQTFSAAAISRCDVASVAAGMRGTPMAISTTIAARYLHVDTGRQRVARDRTGVARSTVTLWDLVTRTAVTSDQWRVQQRLARQLMRRAPACSPRQAGSYVSCVYFSGIDLFRLLPVSLRPVYGLRRCPRLVVVPHGMNVQALPAT